jgi:hypothetical protein
LSLLRIIRSEHVPQIVAASPFLSHPVSITASSTKRSLTLRDLARRTAKPERRNLTAAAGLKKALMFVVGHVVFVRLFA